jgi:hypothetical protein
MYVLRLYASPLLRGLLPLLRGIVCLVLLLKGK